MCWPLASSVQFAFVAARYTSVFGYFFSESSFPLLTRKIKKGVQIKRTKNVRKMKAVAKAISKNEQAEEKVQKEKGKKARIQSAKSLYN